jgi:hypothetical protein
VIISRSYDECVRNKNSHFKTLKMHIGFRVACPKKFCKIVLSKTSKIVLTLAFDVLLKPF